MARCFRALIGCGVFGLGLILDSRLDAAQYNTAEIAIVVTDTQGGVLPGAVVVAMHTASGLRSDRLSDARGRASRRRSRQATTASPWSCPGFGSSR